MNLHGIAARYVGAINPLLLCTLQASTGYTTNADGTQVAQYATFANVQCQVQNLTTRDLRQLDGLNIQGSSRAVYLNGNWFAVLRPGQRGGDLLTLPDGTVYLVTAVLELWPDWAKLSVTLQNGS